MNMNEKILKEFATVVKNYIPEGVDMESIEVIETVKNNGKILHGVIFKEKGLNVAPTLYLENFVDEVNEGKTIADIAQAMVSVFMAHRVPNININFIQDYEQVKNKILPVIMNKGENPKWVSERPHMDLCGDLVVFYKITIDTIKVPDANASVPVTNQLLDLWNISSEQLHGQALENLDTYARGNTIFAPLKEIISNELMDEELMCSIENHPVFVLTNTHNINGTSLVLIPELMAYVLDCLKTSSVKLLPCSLHEWIIIPDIMGLDDTDYLRQVVHEVNGTVVQKEDFLSNDVYCYDRENGFHMI